jgi:shikimate kinase
MPPSDDDAPIFLIGFMASGKTTVGRLLAERLDWTFVDLDEVIEGAAGKTVAEIFAAEGEAGFRKRETDAVREVARRRKTVVATGGGAPCREANIAAMLDAGRVYWLDVTAEKAVARAGTTSGRPLLDNATDPLTAARKLLEARRPFYERAHARLDTEAGDATHVVVALLMQHLLKVSREDLRAMIRDEMIKR